MFWGAGRAHQFFLAYVEPRTVVVQENYCRAFLVSGPVGNDIGGRAGFFIDIMDADVRCDMLTQVVGADAHKLGSVQSGPSVVGVAAGVGRTSLEVEYSTVKAVGGTKADPVDLSAVPCKSAVKAIKSAVSCHKDLTGQNFFGGAAIKYDSAGQLLLFHFGLHADSGSQAGNIKKVVSAALTRSTYLDGILDCADLLAHARKGVQLAKQPDHGMAATPLADYAGRQAGITGLDLKTILL